MGVEDIKAPPCLRILAEPVITGLRATPSPSTLPAVRLPASVPISARSVPALWRTPLTIGVLHERTVAVAVEDADLAAVDHEGSGARAVGVGAPDNVHLVVTVDIAGCEGPGVEEGLLPGEDGGRGERPIAIALDESDITSGSADDKIDDLPPFAGPLIMGILPPLVLPPFLIQVLCNSGSRSRLFDEFPGCPVL